MIQINDFVTKIVFLWVLFYIFLSNIFRNHKKVKKWSKMSKNLKKIFFFKNNEKNMSWKNWLLPKCFQKIELGGYLWVQKWCFCPILLSGSWVPTLGSYSVYDSTQSFRDPSIPTYWNFCDSRWNQHHRSGPSFHILLKWTRDLGNIRIVE